MTILMLPENKQTNKQANLGLDEKQPCFILGFEKVYNQ
jgi:hypothetical protein